MRPPVLNSSRLVLRPARLSDRTWLQELLVDGDIRKKTLQPKVTGMAAVLIAILHTRDARWVVEDRSSGTPLGWVCIAELKPSPHPVIGFEIRRAFWNQGYATEAVNALVAHYLGNAAPPAALGSLVFTDNRPSQRVFEKSGFREVGPRDCQGHPCLMYEMTAERWRARLTS